MAREFYDRKKVRTDLVARRLLLLYQLSGLGGAP
jgi:hypothetical protein